MTLFRGWFLTILVFVVWKTGRSINLRPIVGILTQPYGSEVGGEKVVEDGNRMVHNSYIAASYVKWAESAGARVVPLHFDASDEELTDRFRSINGILFPGGGTSLKNDTSNRFFQAAQLLYRLAVDENKRNPWTFPVHGTCLGFQLLSVLAAEDESVLCEGCFEGTDGDPLPLEFTPAIHDSVLFRDMSPDLLRALSVENITENSHSSGIEPSAFERNSKLAKLFTVLSVNEDVHGRTFVSTFESQRTYPFTGTQWHPEKANFEFGKIGSLGYNAIPHTADAVAVSQYVANQFIANARLSNHTFPTVADEKAALIYNDVGKLTADPNGYFDQVYLYEGATTM